MSLNQFCSQCFDTEQRMIYQGHDALKHPVPKSFKKVPPAYERPSVPVEGLTVTHVSWINLLCLLSIANIYTRKTNLSTRVIRTH